MKPLALILTLGFAGNAFAQAFPTEVSSKHYDLKGTTTKEQAQDLLDFMELVHETYMAVCKPENKEDVEKRKSTIILYKDEKEYTAKGAPKGSAAYYSLETKNLVGFFDPSMMHPYFAHEGMHQFTDLTSKNFRDFPMWFSEGIADCIGNCEVRNKKLFMCVKSGLLARGRLPIIQAALKNNKAYKLSELFRLNQPKFMGDADLCYAQSWSFCHFLMTYPGEEDRQHQIPDGKYQRHLATYYQTIRKGGTNHDKAWAEAFKDAPLDKLEAEWKQYVLKLTGGRFLGVMGKEIDPEEADSLNLGKEYSAIRIDDLVKDGAAQKAGIQKGDLLVKFDGKRFKRKEALENLRIWMQEAIGGAHLVALRDGKEVEFSVGWKK